jgi:hypothetical protein
MQEFYILKIRTSRKVPRICYFLFVICYLYLGFGSEVWLIPFKIM